MLWPVLHSCMPSIEMDDSDWQAYANVNRLFAKTIAADVRPGDIVWIHDYHLFLLPRMLREEIGHHARGIKIGFFLHVPFPDVGTWQQMRGGDEIVRSVLQSDVIGFHTDHYVQNFVQCCSPFIKSTRSPNIFESDGKLVTVKAFPIGIDPIPFIKGLRQPEVRGKLTQLKKVAGTRKMIIGVDRLDSLKGIPEKLKAFDAFLVKNPKWRGNVVLVQVIVPSRGGSEESKALNSEIRDLAQKTNRKFGKLGNYPVHLIPGSVCPDELVALYAAADMCLISSVQDGMNLVAFEYVAAQFRNKGVLLLSQYAGACHRLRGSIVVDPLNTCQMARAIKRGLTMKKSCRKSRHARLLRHVLTYTR